MKVCPEQIVAVKLLMVAKGNTVTFKVKGEETQLVGRFGVTVYVAVCTTLEVFVRNPVILVPLPVAPPVIDAVIPGVLQV